jgi:hypothetical protein
MLTRIGIIAGLALLLDQSAVLAQNEALLNGRYSFVAHGNRSQEVTEAPGDHVSRAGTLKFDGSGRVTAARFMETTDGHSALFGGDGAFKFSGGSYTVPNNEFGHLTLTFAADFGGQSPPQYFSESWDIALTDGGKGFFLNVELELIQSAPGNPAVDQEVTIGGEARVQ